MDLVTLARWQFGITTVYHFLMVPLTIGLGLVVAWFQTRWYRTGDEAYLRLTKFFGKLFLTTSPWAWSPGSCRSSSSA